MVEGMEIGNILLRGSHLIGLDKEPGVFTAIAPDKDERERLRALPGVREVKQVASQIYKAYVESEQRDLAMDRYRSDGVCHHSYKPAGASRTRYYLSDQVVVRFRSDTAGEFIQSLIADAGLRQIQAYPDPAKIFVLQVTDKAGKNPIKVANELIRHPAVEYAEPDLVNRFHSAYLPEDPGFQLQWHLHSWDGDDVVAGADIAVAEAWEITRGTRDVAIAVIDDGFELSHPDFTGEGKIVHPFDYVESDIDPSPGQDQGDYHGTPCAGVALAEENGLGVVGVAPGCAFMPIRVSFQQRDSDWLNIFHDVGQHADVISCSWGPPPVWAPLPQSLTDKFHELTRSGGSRGNGCVIVFAAHNYNAPLNDPDNTYFEWRSPDDPPGQYQLTQEPILNGLAAHPDVMAVTASTSLNRKAAYSNWGNEISVCAPSSNGHSLDPHKAMPGLGIWTTDNELETPGLKPGSQFTGAFGGTSSATPVVAGVAALVRSANPDVTATEIKQILQNTADKIIDPDPDPILGLRKGAYDENGHSEWFGYGKVNAARAVQRAMKMLRDTHNLKRGLPREQYARVYILLPQDAYTEWIQAVFSSGEWTRSLWTVGFSADDAGIGNLDQRIVLAVNPETWGGDMAAWYAEHYPGVKFLPVQAPTPVDVTNYLNIIASDEIAALLAKESGESAEDPNRGQPREQYGRMYLLLPQNSLMAQLQAVVDSRVLTKYRWTVGFSADDAGIGDLDNRIVVAVNPDEWGTHLRGWFGEHYPSVMYDEVRVTTPGQLRDWLANR